MFLIHRTELGQTYDKEVYYYDTKDQHVLLLRNTQAKVQHLSVYICENSEQVLHWHSPILLRGYQLRAGTVSPVPGEDVHIISVLTTSKQPIPRPQ